MAAEWVARLTALGLNLPEVAVPVAAYVPAVAHGDVIYVSGQLPSVRGRVEYTGRLGAERTIEEGYAAARLCALNALAAAASVANGPEGVGPVLWLQGFVQSATNFYDQAKVVNGASELLGQIFPDRPHARVAVGVASLPLNVPVEVAAIFERIR